MSEQDNKRKGLLGRLFGSKFAPQPEPVEPANTPASDEAPFSPVHEAAAPDANIQEPIELDGHAALDLAVPPSPEAHETSKPSWFQRLKSGLGKTSSKLTSGITGLLTKRRLDGATLEDLEDLLIQSDLGVATAARITAAIAKGRFEKGISAEDVRSILAAEVERVLAPVAKPLVINPANRPHVVMMVGVNGTGKTTTIGKLAAQFAREGRTVVIAAGDTFRAAAIEQLQVWGVRSNARVIARHVGADSAGLAYDALKDAIETGADVLLLDTAGRLQNKHVLMEELEKVTRVLKKLQPEAPHDVILVLDATTGQNALQQVEVFRDRAGVTGLVMTKLDGTARGGILVAIAEKFGLPVHAIGIGEGIDDLQPFAAVEFARAIAET